MEQTTNAGQGIITLSKSQNKQEVMTTQDFTKTTSEYFLNTYEAEKSAFLEKVQSWKHTVPEIQTGLFFSSKADTSLTTDWALIPASEQKKNLLLITSGIHGVEGHAGSAIISYLMDVLRKQERFKNTSILIMHSINPWGQKNDRRVTENNVDLNRNFFLPPKYVHKQNKSYSIFDQFLNKQEKVVITSFLGPQYQDLTSLVKMVWKYSIKKFREAAIGGQYEYPKGIFYGGNEPEGATAQTNEFLVSMVSPFENLIHFDLHTGYGKSKALHLIRPSAYKTQDNSLFKDLCDQLIFEDMEGDDFYHTQGDFISLWPHLFPNKQTLGIVLEYGTSDNHTKLGGIRSLNIMRLENQSYHFGVENESTKERIKSLFREQFYPESYEWRSSVLNNTDHFIEKVLSTLKKAE